MNKKIEILFEKSRLNDFDSSNLALADLGLLVERHLQDRYHDEGYLHLLSSKEIYKIKLEDIEIEYIINFFFYHILNINQNPITVAWCLGKCYGFDIIFGIIRLLNVFNEDDEVCLQLLCSINSLYDFRNVKNHLLPTLNKIKIEGKLNKTIEQINELYSLFNIK